MKEQKQEGAPYESPAPYGDDDIPEIDLPGKANAVNAIPEELPGRSQASHLRSL